MSDTILINGLSIQAATAAAGKSMDKAEGALRVAVFRVSKWARNQAITRLGRSIKVSSRIIKGRTLFKLDDLKGRVWVGLSDVGLHRVKPKPRKTATGVTAGGVTRPGAFIVQKYSKNVFERVGKERFPLKKSAGLPIYDAGTKSMESIAGEIGPRLAIEFERALQFGRSKK